MLGATGTPPAAGPDRVAPTLAHESAIAVKNRNSGLRVASDIAVSTANRASSSSPTAFASRTSIGSSAGSQYGHSRPRPGRNTCQAYPAAAAVSPSAAASRPAARSRSRGPGRFPVPPGQRPAAGSEPRRRRRAPGHAVAGRDQRDHVREVRVLARSVTGQHSVSAGLRPTQIAGEVSQSGLHGIGQARRRSPEAPATHGRGPRWHRRSGRRHPAAGRDGVSPAVSRRRRATRPVLRVSASPIAVPASSTAADHRNACTDSTDSRMVR